MNKIEILTFYESINYILCDSLYPPFHYPLRALGHVGSTSRRPGPIIPIIQNSNIPIVSEAS
jgi:hypothetical protein